MLLGLMMIIGALLWARKLRHEAAGAAPSYRGPWIMGAIGAMVFLFYLWLVTQGASQA